MGGTAKRAAKSAAAPVSVRERILCAAFELFHTKGYHDTSTLAIATRAKVSKRELYALFGGKRAMLAAGIEATTKQMGLPPEFPVPRDRAGLEVALAAFGANFLRKFCQPHVLATFRLAIGEAERAPEMARVLNASGRDGNRAALRAIIERAQQDGLLGSGDANTIATQFFALVWAGLQISLLLRVAPPPGPAEIERRARDAANAILRLYPIGGMADRGLSV